MTFPLSSTSIIASNLYVRRNEVSLVAYYGVQWYPHKIPGISSAHSPLAWPNIFFNLFSITLLIAFA